MTGDDTGNSNGNGRPDPVLRAIRPDQPETVEPAGLDDAATAGLTRTLDRLVNRLDTLEKRLETLDPPAAPPVRAPVVAANPQTVDRHARIASRFGHSAEAGPAANNDSGPATADSGLDNPHAPDPFPFPRTREVEGEVEDIDDPDDWDQDRPLDEPVMAAPLAVDLDHQPEPVIDRRPKRRRRAAVLVVYWIIILGVIGGTGWVIFRQQEQVSSVVTALLGPDGLEQPADEVIAVPAPSSLDEDELAPSDPEEILAGSPADPEGGLEVPNPAETSAPPAGDEPAPQTVVADGPTVPALPAPSVEVAGLEEVLPAADGGTPEASAEDLVAPPSDVTAGIDPADTTAPVTDETAPEPTTEPTQASELSNPAPLPADAPDELLVLAQLSVSGDPESAFDLADHYFSGEVIPQDYERAAHWYREAANAGIADAYFQLSEIFRDGLGTQADERQAVELLATGASFGSIRAQRALGLRYVSGDGVPADRAGAANLFRQAWENGDGRSAFLLGELYEAGLDGLPDVARAEQLYTSAADAGVEEASAALRRLETSRAAQTTPAPEPVAQAEVVAVPVPETPQVLREPDREATGFEVREIQQLLTELGYEPGVVDGLMGTRTRNAISDYQRNTGVDQTGDPTLYLLQALRRDASG